MKVISPCDFLHHDNSLSVFPSLVSACAMWGSNVGDDKVKRFANSCFQQVVQAGRIMQGFT